jgi:hypothetical protein
MNAEGCTAKEIIYYTQAAQSECTYDAMESLFFLMMCVSQENLVDLRIVGRVCRPME